MFKKMYGYGLLLAGIGFMLVLAGIIQVEPVQAQAGAGTCDGTNLGIMQDFNVVTWSDVQHDEADFQGRAAIGGNFSQQNGAQFTFCNGRFGAGTSGDPINGDITNGAVIRGTLTATGDINVNESCSVQVGGSATATGPNGFTFSSNGTDPAGTLNASQGTAAIEAIFDFDSAQIEAQNISATLDSFASNATVVDAGGGVLQATFNEDNAHGMYVIDITEAQFDGSAFFQLDIDTSAYTGAGEPTIVINVDGITLHNTTDNFGRIRIDGVTWVPDEITPDTEAQRVMWNFPNATSLTLGGTWRGSVLAPYANVVYDAGHINGQLMSNQLSMTNLADRGEMHDDAFRGCLVSPLTAIGMDDFAAAGINGPLVAAGASLMLLALLTIVALTVSRRRPDTLA